MIDYKIITVNMLFGKYKYYLLLHKKFKFTNFVESL